MWTVTFTNNKWNSRNIHGIIAAHQLGPVLHTTRSSFQPPHMGSPGPDGACFAPLP